MQVRADNHLGVRVSNLERAGQFYIEALDAHWLTTPLPLSTERCEVLFGGPAGGTARYAFIGFKGGMAFELIEFDDPPVPFAHTNVWEERFMHFCFTTRDVRAVLERVEAAGGERFDLYPTVTFRQSGRSEFESLYFRDLDGNLFQLIGLPMAELADVLNAQPGDDAVSGSEGE
jgi:catechol 2,3-dioxygenase-like lactoylglutathione lyase family enzyme